VNLHAIASGAISAVNSFETVAASQSTGYVTNPDGSTTPQYTTTSYWVDIQALQYRDLLQLDRLNIQGTRRKMYVNGEIDGIVRMLNKGGDVITRSDGTIWKVTFVFEQWNDAPGPSWCSVCLTQQV
jgi:hypothetical protein